MAAHTGWGSRLGVILAVTGSAVGLGNFLKFPGQLAEYGGGFLIPYAVALLVIGLPLCWVEWTMGRAGGARGVNSVPGILLALTGRRWASVLGAAAPAVPLVIYGYYIVIEGWCLYYAWDTERLWVGLVGLGRDWGMAPGLAAAVVLCAAINLAVVYRGINRGIELVCTWGMPVLVLCAIAVVARVLTLGTVTGADGIERTVADGLGAVWNLERTVSAGGATRTVSLAATLSDPRAWLAAAGQIFFTLSLGMGVLMTYASYMRTDDDVALSATTAAAGNEFCEVAVGGMMTVPAAVLFLGAGVLVAVPGLFGLGFVALPKVFAAMPGGQVFGFLFFFLLFLAAVTSSLSMLQPAVAFLEEGFGRSRRAAVLLIGAITAPGVVLVCWLSAGLTALDTMDFWMGTLGVVLCALLVLVSFAWLWGLRAGLAELRRGAGIPIPVLIGPIVAWVAPAALLAILGAFLWNEILAKDSGGRIAALADWRTALPAAYALGMGALFVVLGALAQARLRRRIGGEP
ncbi:MAG: hypothetical protein RLZZ127_2294 [Planctomycetota bacterium]|jgi:SNF family Na+-dependent transporter